MGPILHPAQLTLSVTQVSFLACTRRKADFSLHGRTSKWPCAPGGGSAKKEACSGANVPWCYLAVSEKPFRHWPGKRWFKDNGALFRCYFNGASLVRAHCWRSQGILPAKLRIVLIYCMASCVTFRSCQWLIRCSWEICMYVNLNCNNCGNLPLRLFNRS